MRVIGCNAHDESSGHQEQEADDERTALADLVRGPSNDNGEDRSRDVDWYRHELRRARCIAQGPDDRGEEQTNAVERANNLERFISDGSLETTCVEEEETYTPVDEEVNPDLPVGKRLPDILPFELLGLSNSSATLGLDLTLILQTVDHKRSLLLGQECRCLGKVMQHPKGQGGNDDGENAFEDENPAPSFITTNTVHLADTEGQQATERTSNGGGGEEQRLSELNLLANVPVHTEVIRALNCHTR